jgi:hypothetical protein
MGASDVRMVVVGSTQGIGQWTSEQEEDATMVNNTGDLAEEVLVCREEQSKAAF